MRYIIIVITFLIASCSQLTNNSDLELVKNSIPNNWSALDDGGSERTISQRLGRIAGATGKITWKVGSAEKYKEYPDVFVVEASIERSESEYKSVQIYFVANRENKEVEIASLKINDKTVSMFEAIMAFQIMQVE